MCKGKLVEKNVPESLVNDVEHILGRMRVRKAPRDEVSTVIKILFLAANPTDTTRLRLDEESRAIDQALRQAEFRDKFDIKQHWAVRVTDLQGYLLRHKPDIVHFSGHGGQSSEIILEDNAGASHPVSVRALSTLFSVLKDNIRCVVLNACYSEQQAHAIAEHIDCVIGMSTAIGDSAAISFATAFYQALGYGRDVKTAFDLGCVQVDMENLNEQDTPKLLVSRSDSKQIMFVHSDEQPRSDVSRDEIPKVVRDTSSTLQVPAAVVSQLETLADHINQDLELLKEFETTMQLEGDPRRKVKYRREIEVLKKSISGYLHDYIQLRSSGGKLPSTFQDTDAGLLALAEVFIEQDQSYV